MCTVVATALSAAGSLMQGYAAKSAAGAEAAAAEQNARIADIQATEAVQRGGREEGNLREQLAALRGRQRVLAAASGVDIDSGSMNDIQESSMIEGEQDVSTNALNHAREAWGHNVEAVNYRNQAASARAAGSNAMLGGILGAGTSLLSLATPKATGASNTIYIGEQGSVLGPERYTFDALNIAGHVPRR